MRVAELQPGDRFTASSGTAWELERHDGPISWAIRLAVPGEVDRPYGPVGVGERDRFSPDANVRRGAP